jgi:hypothetical protein
MNPNLQPNPSEPAERTCVVCGRAESEWRGTENVSHPGGPFCCDGCAEGKQCVCELRQTAPISEEEPGKEKAI